MLLGAYWARAGVLSQPQSIPRKMPYAQRWGCPWCPWLPCSRLRLWDSPGWQGPALPPTQLREPPSQPRGAASLSLLEGSIISSWKGLIINPGFLENVKPKQTLFVRTSEDFPPHTPFCKATACCKQPSAIIASQQVKTMKISIAVQHTLRIRVIYVQ